MTDFYLIRKLTYESNLPTASSFYVYPKFPSEENALQIVYLQGSKLNYCSPDRNPCLQAGILYQKFSPAPAKLPEQESNLYLEFRKLLFYPLNYRAILPAGYSIHWTTGPKELFIECRRLQPPFRLALQRRDQGTRELQI